MNELMKLYQELKDKVQAWWDDLYPPDVFTGISGDEGAIRVAEIRKILEKIDRTKPKALDKPDSEGWWLVLDHDQVFLGYVLVSGEMVQRQIHKEVRRNELYIKTICTYC